MTPECSRVPKFRSQMDSDQPQQSDPISAENVEKVFQEVERSYHSTPDGWRLATYEEAKDGIETIKKKKLLKRWDRARLLDGWITGAGYDYEMGDDFKGCLGYMLLIQIPAQASGGAYADVHLSDRGKGVALFLCVDDWNYEVVYWLLKGWSNSETMNVRDMRERNIPFSDVKNFVEMNKMMGHVSRRLGEEGGKALEKAGKTKYSGKDSVKEVLSGMNKIVTTELKDIVQFIGSMMRFSIINTYNKYRLPDCVNREDIPDSLWRFVCDNFASYVVEVCARRCLIELRKMKTESDLMVATSILLHLSDFRSDMLHEPLAHNCKGNCGTKILQNTAERAAGNQEKFYEMLKSNALWSCCDDILDKLLAIVAKSKYYEIEGRDKLAVVDLLLKCGARPGRRYAIGKYKNKTVLHSVAKFKDRDLGIDVARALIYKCDEKRVDEFVNAADERGMTALHLASSKGNARICELLIGHGASVTVEDKNGMTSLHYALEEEFDKVMTEVAKILLDRCDEQNMSEFVNAKNKNKHGRSALHCAAEKGNAHVCRLLLDHSAEVTYKDTKGKTALQYVFEGEIYKVVRAGKEIVQALLSSCEKKILCDFVNTTDERGRTALHGASEKGNSHICELLIDHGASVTAQDEKGMTALHYAFEGEIDRVRGLGTEIAKVLLSRCDEPNIDNFINAADKSGRTALHRASEKSNAHICRMLVDHRASLSFTNKNGMTALHYAVEGPISKDMHVETEIAQVLLDKSNEQNMHTFVNAADGSGKTALHRVSEKGNADIFGLLLKHGAVITLQDNEGKTELHYALEGRIGKDIDVGTKIAEALLRQCDEQNLNELIIKPDNSGRTPLHSASQTGNVHMCELLLHRGTSVTAKDKEDKTALHYLVEGLHHYDTGLGTKIAQALLAKCDKQDVDQFVNAEDANGMTALHSASLKGNARICALLLDRGASVTAKDKKGKTALYYAFEGDDKDIDVRTEIAETLLCRSDKRDIDKYINAEDDCGRTVLHRASEKGNAYICELLLDHGASLTARDKESKTTLHYAFEWIDRDIVVGTKIAEGLLHRCDNQIVYEFINAEDENGRTALHCASEKGDASICALLVDRGALVTLQDKKGKTALHYAVERRNDKAIDVLLKSSHVSFSLDLRDIEGSTPLDIALANKDSKSTAKFLLMSKDSEAYLDEAIPCIDDESTAKLLVNLKEPEAYFNKVNREQLLRKSLLLGSVDVVAKLFERGVRLPAGDRDEDGKTALHLAAMCDNESNAIEIISLRIGKETRENCKGMVANQDGKGRTVLHEAAFNGHEDLCQGLLLLNSGLIFTKDNNQRSPLHDVVDGKYKDAALIKQLMKAYLKKVRPKGDLVDRRGLTPLHVAASLGKAQAVKVLLSNNKIKTEYVSRGDILSQTALHKAAKCGDVDTVKILLDHGAHPLKERDSDGRTALHNVVQAQITEPMKVKLAELLFNRCELKEDKSLLLWASAAGLGTPGDIIKDGPLHDFFEKIKIMLKEDKSLTEKFNGNLLKIAASQGNIEMTKELISRGYQIGDIRNTEWKEKLREDNRGNVDKVLRQIDMITEQGNDKPTISDNLGRLDYAQGLAALFLNPYIKPPIAVGITGTWGMGKSSLMLQTECVLLATAAHIALLPSSKLSSSALELPDLTPGKISKKGKRKREQIYRQIKRAERDFIKSEVNSYQEEVKGSQEEKLGNFLNELEERFLKQHDLKYLKIFKALAAMDSSDISRLEADPSAEENVHAVLTVQYSAWKYRDEMEAFAGIAVEITKELEGIMTPSQWLSTCWRNTWIKKRYSLWIELFFPLLALILASSFTWIAWVVFGSEKLKEWGSVKYAWPPAAFVTILWALTKSAMGILKPVSSQLMQYMSFPDHSDKLGYQDRVISDIRFLRNEIGRKAYWVFVVFAWVWTAFIALWDLITGSWITSSIFHERSRERGIQVPKIAPAVGSNLRIIVFVDDLDRCEESVILQVLSAVNLVLGVCEISVVIGMDKRLIERAIINKYKDESLEAKELADMYLQKIIQLPLDLPDPSEEESQRFLTGQLGGSQNESIPSTNDTGSSSTDGRERKPIVQQDNAVEHAITMETTGEIEHIGPSNLSERSAPTESREATTSETVDGATTTGSTNLQQRSAPNEARKEALPQTDGNATITGKQEQSSSLLIREMLFVRYSKGEEEAFVYFQKSATGYRKLPREWKRLLNYHRLVWYIFSVTNDAKNLDGWQVQLITWIFICWEWREYMNIVIEKWKEIGDLKTSAPSLLMAVEHLINTKAISYENSEKARSKKSDNSMERKLDELEKMLAELTKEMKELKGIPSDEMKNNMKELSKQVSTDLREDIKEIKEQIVRKGVENNEGIEGIEEVKDQITKEESGWNEEKWNKNRDRMKSSLEKYDVSMQGIQVFQRFRFHCTAGYLAPLVGNGK